MVTTFKRIIFFLVSLVFFYSGASATTCYTEIDNYIWPLSTSTYTVWFKIPITETRIVYILQGTTYSPFLNDWQFCSIDFNDGPQDGKRDIYCGSFYVNFNTTTLSDYYYWYTCAPPAPVVSQNITTSGAYLSWGSGAYTTLNRSWTAVSHNSFLALSLLPYYILAGAVFFILGKALGIFKFGSGN